MEDYREAIKSKKWDNVKFVRGKEDITKENNKWIQDHFANYEKKDNRA